MNKSNRESDFTNVAQCYNYDCHWLQVVTRDLFGTEDFTGMRVLDIGAGRGQHSCTVAALGAKEVIALEPEWDGSRPEVINTFEANINKLGMNNITLIKEPLDRFSAEDQSFDRILMYSVINHLDEEKVVDLDQNKESFNYYLKTLKPIFNWLKPGGELVVHDAARSHVFSSLLKAGILKRNPRYPTIEWEKHQNPEIWVKLFEETGFTRMKYHWGVYTRHDFIRKLLGWSSFISWLINPHFIIRAVRP